MSRRIILPVILIAVLSLVFFSCSRDRAVEPRGAGEQVPDDTGMGNMAGLDRQLESSPEIRELIAVRDEIAGRALERRVTEEQVREAGLDAQKGNELLGLSDAEAAELWGRVNAALGSLYARFPELGGRLGGTRAACGACDAEQFAIAWGGYVSRASSIGIAATGSAHGPEGAPARPPMKCKWAQLGVGFAMCAIKSGGSLLIYAICSFGVFCASCDGGIADIVCP